MTTGSCIIRATIKGLDRTSAVHQRAVTTTRHGNTNVRQIRGIARVFVQVRGHIEIADLNMTEEILHSRQRLIPTSLQP
jgi:hypothetical protein